MLQECYNETLIKESLKRRIYAAGHTPTSFAKLTGVSQKTLSNLLAADLSFNPTLHTLLVIADGLDVTIDELLLIRRN